MKLHILSDLHLSVGALEPPHTDADVVVLAGDEGSEAQLARLAGAAAERPEDPAQWRRLGLGAQILADLGVHRLRVMGTPRKLVGLAQRRQRTGVLLVAGTLACRPDWALLCDALGRPDDVPAMLRRTVSCADLRPGPWDAQRLAASLREALAQALALPA